MAGKMAGLICVLSVSSILNVLVYTKQSSTPTTAYKRYLATVLHTFTWYDTDTELKPGSRWVIITKEILSGMDYQNYNHLKINVIFQILEIFRSGSKGTFNGQ